MKELGDLQQGDMVYISTIDSCDSRIRKEMVMNVDKMDEYNTVLEIGTDGNAYCVSPNQIVDTVPDDIYEPFCWFVISVDKNEVISSGLKYLGGIKDNADLDYYNFIKLNS